MLGRDHFLIASKRFLGDGELIVGARVNFLVNMECILMPETISLVPGSKSKVTGSHSKVPGNFLCSKE